METTTLNEQDAPGSSRPAGRPLRRACDGRMLAGVAAGLADHLGVDVTMTRIAFVVLTAFGGLGIPVYAACMLLIPEEGADESLAGSLMDSLQARPR